MDKLTESGQSTTNVSGEIKNEEFQIALYIAQKIELIQHDTTFSPYVGVIYNSFETETNSKVKYQTATTAYELSWSLEEDDAFGIVAGTDVNLGNNFAMNIEWRFIAETAITAGVGCKF